jgi:hypothetical protein
VVAVFQDIDVGLGVAIVEVGVADVHLLGGRDLRVPLVLTIRSEHHGHRGMVFAAAIGPSPIRLRQVETIGEMHVDDATRRRSRRRHGFREQQNVRRPA